MDPSSKILVTGGLGFIGKHFVTLLLSRGYEVFNIDKMTYAARKDEDFEASEKYHFIKADIVDLTELPTGISCIVNFAAESHVDNSISFNFDFLHSNTQGVYNLLELVRKLPKEKQPLFIQISTDEVYGDIPEGAFKETDRLNPSNPYSASKAAADVLVHAWTRTYDLRTRICRSSNNYGYRQHPEKLIARTMKLAYNNQKMTIHGDGSYVREWTFVGDNCEAIYHVMTKGVDGEIYNISSKEALTNLEVVKKILKAMGKSDDMIEFVPNRPGQDLRYAVNTDKVRSLGWKPTTALEEYLPICEELNQNRRNAMGPGRKKSLLSLLRRIVTLGFASTR